MINVSGCRVYHGHAVGVDLQELEDLNADMKYESSMAMIDISVLYDDSRSNPYVVQSRALSYILSDLRALSKKQTFSTIFTRSLPMNGQIARYNPRICTGDTVIMPYGNYEGGTFIINGTECKLQPGDALVIPEIIIYGVKPWYRVLPFTGTMNLISLHTMKNF